MNVQDAQAACEKERDRAVRDFEAVTRKMEAELGQCDSQIGILQLELATKEEEIANLKVRARPALPRVSAAHLALRCVCVCVRV